MFGNMIGGMPYQSNRDGMFGKPPMQMGQSLGGVIGQKPMMPMQPQQSPLGILGGLGGQGAPGQPGPMLSVLLSRLRGNQGMK